MFTSGHVIKMAVTPLNQPYPKTPYCTQTSEWKFLPIEVLHCGNRNFQSFWLWPLPWPDDLHIRTQPIVRGDTPHVEVWTSYIKSVEGYRHTDMTKIIYQASSRAVNNITLDKAWATLCTIMQDICFPENSQYPINLYCFELWQETVWLPYGEFSTQCKQNTNCVWYLHLDAVVFLSSALGIRRSSGVCICTSSRSSGIYDFRKWSSMKLSQLCTNIQTAYISNITSQRR